MGRLFFDLCYNGVRRCERHGVKELPTLVKILLACMICIGLIAGIVLFVQWLR